MIGNSLIVAVLVSLILSPISMFGLSLQGRPADNSTRSPDLTRVEEQIIAATNQFRRQQERSELKLNAELSKVARSFAQYIAEKDKYGHEADGKNPAERVAEAGYQYCIVEENIAFEYNSVGFTTDELVKGFMQNWEKSPPHRKNLLDPDLDDIGVGVARSSKTGKYYAVQDFGRPKSKEIEFQIANRTDETVNYQLGDQTFSLKPRYTMTHKLCRPSDLMLREKNARAKGGETLLPSNGSHYSIRGDAARTYKIVKDRN